MHYEKSPTTSSPRHDIGRWHLETLLKGSSFLSGLKEKPAAGVPLKWGFPKRKARSSVSEAAQV